ncbi:MAG: oxaloacetate decarboxylase [Clostridia bacterium]|nr:oxaloacetate decarboxylase [Clostridia bacterium]
MMFLHYLKYMGTGMLGVFIIIGVIMAATYAISKITAKKADSYEKR